MGELVRAVAIPWMLFEVWLAAKMLFGPVDKPFTDEHVWRALILLGLIVT